MTSPTKIFNTHFKEMCNDLLILFPNYKPLVRSQYTLEILLKTKPSTIIKFWKVFSIKYQSNLDENGLHFFVNHDFTEDVKVFNAEYILDYIQEVNILIKDMDESNKSKILEYIQNLSKISKLY